MCGVYTRGAVGVSPRTHPLSNEFDSPHTLTYIYIHARRLQDHGARSKKIVKKVKNPAAVLKKMYDDKIKTMQKSILAARLDDRFGVKSDVYKEVRSSPPLFFPVPFVFAGTS